LKTRRPRDVHFLVFLLEFHPATIRALPLS